MSESVMNPGELEMKLVYNLWETYAAFVRFLELRTESPLRSLTLTQWRTLNLIYFNPGKSQSDLANEIDITRASMSSIVNFFEKQKLVRRKRAPRRNTYELSLTARGNREIRAFFEQVDDVEREISVTIGAKQSALAIELLRELHSMFIENTERKHVMSE